ncbi:hypothetical protein APS56_07670 [Pseudalgibacter alginicilyticus]|uniref:HTH araC/xylS-type domain-containing protein n=1 Tax=Pseudalgibacter alginicilyticus TaxID=1736674 RepID=A0A0P0D4C8_9FLAO|nr:AraC family transcriptional regulator [Pseudalgibacter alginicilyticus]ALJ05008.1 hypothetical protein APS56_07670 [Pseudalgibacter alginicilyticus]
MKTILRSPIFENNVLVKTFEKDFKSTDFKENTVKIDDKYGKGNIIEIQLNGVIILIRDLKINEHSINVFHDFPFFKLQFEIEGSSHYIPFNKLSKEVYIPNNHYNLFYLPEVDGVLNYKTNNLKTLEIIFTENYIEKIIGKRYKKTLNKFGMAVTNKRPFLLWKKSKPIPTELQAHINEIINCKYTKDLKKPYLQAKVNELLIYLLAKTNEEYDKKPDLNLPEIDYINILKIETYIRNNLKEPLTISELAFVAGMNTSKLKQAFKIVFSTTIFKYITRLRMEKAKYLIEKEAYTINEASYEIGYKHAHHFTTAFKKTYGILPSKLILK